jgi:Na+-translocating ferredoxin:NAD+ oxidoreductase RnfD subunit
MMRVVAAPPLARREWLLRLVRTPKGTLVLVLLVLAAVTAPAAGSAGAWRAVGIAAAVAVALELALARLRGWGWVLPDGALLSGLLVAMVLSPLVAWWIPAATSALAIAGKHTLRIRRGHVFNPAALALALAALLRLGGQSWWGAVARPQWLVVALLVASGLLVADRVNRFAMVGAFLGTYLGLLAFVALWIDPDLVRETYRPPFVNAGLFFAFFMLDDPPTSPGRPRAQTRYGSVVAVASLVAFLLLHQLAFLPLGVLAGNLWHAWHRLRTSRGAR